MIKSCAVKRRLFAWELQGTLCKEGADASCDHLGTFEFQVPHHQELVCGLSRRATGRSSWQIGRN